jgi:3-deoxy-D-manno-octulosonic-acid transferase
VKTWIYSWIIYPLGLSIARIIGLFSSKVRETLKLRAWKDFLSLRFNVGEPIEYWIHVASQGELEYAIPIIEELKNRKKRVLVTYYSISAKRGVEQLPSQYFNVSLVVPLPHDGLGLMKEFVSLVASQGVKRILLLKYELWPGLLHECRRLGIKVILVDALKPSWFHQRLLHKVDGILTGYSSEIESVTHRFTKVVGDTRVERVVQRTKQGNSKLSSVMPSSALDYFRKRPTLILGSMWPKDTDAVTQGLALVRQQLGYCPVNLIWLPHELDKGFEAQARRAFTALGYKTVNIDAVTSEKDLWNNNPTDDSLRTSPVALIVMKKGFLAELYTLARLAYVGGGFGTGLHNVLEPFLAGALVCCGPDTDGSPEAHVLASQSVLLTIKNPDEFAQWLISSVKRIGSDESAQTKQKVSAVIDSILKEHLGASERIIEVCEQSL